MKIPDVTRLRWLKTAVWIAIAAVLSSRLAPFTPAEQPDAKPAGIRGKIVLPRAGHDWMSQQVEEPCILPNPKVPGRLIMFYSAVSSSNRVVAAVGKAWAEARDPFDWHQDEANPVLRPSQRGWDSSTIRLDAVLYIPEEDAYYIYCSGTTGTVQDRIGLAICPTGADGYSGVTEAAIGRYGTAPVLAPEPAAPFHEDMASQAAVMREWNDSKQTWDWYMYYSYRGKDGTLPGIRLATSHDGKTWTRHFNADDLRGMGQVFRSTPDAYYEWHQVFKTGATYVLCIEVGVDHGARWRPVLAVSKDPVQGWTQLPVDTVLQTTWEGLYDDRTLYHVATPALYPIEGKWYLFAQACGRPASGNYIDGAWEMWAIACERLISTRPGCAELHVPGVRDALKLTQAQASSFARLGLKAIQKEYPNKPEHVLNSAADVRGPRALHPAFYGSFDWHSSVHGHWMLVRLLRRFPDLPERQPIRAMLEEHLTLKNLQAEADYFTQPNRQSFERTYGWAWFLKLAEELHGWDDPDGKRWSSNLRPLTDAIVARYLAFFPKQTYPIRTGVHPNTAFGLSFAIDYARAAGHKPLQDLVEERSRAYFAKDAAIPAAWEPGGTDFFSPSLMEADLMRRVLSPREFQAWLRGFLPGLENGEPKTLFVPAQVTDRSDPQLVHLDGLNLSRAWCMRQIAAALPKDDPVRKTLVDSAARHMEAALPHVASGDYMGEHWLATFAVYLLWGQAQP